MTIASLFARSPLLPDKSSDINFATENNCFQRITDTVFNLRLAYSNRMVLGRPFSTKTVTVDDDEVMQVLDAVYNAEFPAQSGHEYLYAAGLWVGGIKNGDTLVSTGFDLVYSLPEFIPPECPEGEFQTTTGLGDREHLAIAYDTSLLIDTSMYCQIGNCGGWRPLGLKVSSHSYAWETPPYNDIVVIEYTIENIDTEPITDAWVGIFSDCDIGMGDSSHIDDVSGFMGEVLDTNGSWVDLKLAYSLDPDGDPVSWWYGENSVRGAFGVQVLDLSVSDWDVNFNWWTTPIGSFRDWGPRQADNPERDNGIFYMIPQGDSNKYAMMSYPEIDYNQIEAGLSYPGWAEPTYVDKLSAAGRDTRFLISAGPFDLAPTEEVVFTVAYLAADSLVYNAFFDLWFNPEDAACVADFYELTSLDTLQMVALEAHRIIENGLEFPPPGPPDNFTVEDYDENSADLIWSAKPVSDLAGYDIYQQTDGGEWVVITTVAAPDTTATISDLSTGEAYAFKIAAVDEGGRAGLASPEVQLVTGQPNPVKYLTGTGRDGYPQIFWSPSPIVNLAHYRVYRTDVQTDVTVTFDANDTTYIDDTAESGRVYEYGVSAVNDIGLESVLSAPLSLINYLSQDGILVIDQNEGRLTSNLIFNRLFLDSLIETALTGREFDIWRVNDSGFPDIYDLALYSSIVYSSENRRGYLVPEAITLLEEYFDLEGRAVFILRQATLEVEPTSDITDIGHNPSSFFSEYLKLDSTIVGPLIVETGYQLYGDLIGVDPASGSYPILEWDSVRVNSFGYALLDGLPYCGYLVAQAEATPIQTFNSSQASYFDGRVNGIKYLNDRYRFFLLNYPLSLMKTPEAADFLAACLSEMEDFAPLCGDINGDNRVNLADASMILAHLYFELKAIKADADLNCSASVSIDDFLVLTNYIFYGGPAPCCCRKDEGGLK